MVFSRPCPQTNQRYYTHPELLFVMKLFICSGPILLPPPFSVLVRLFSSLLLTLGTIPARFFPIIDKKVSPEFPPFLGSFFRSRRSQFFTSSPIEALKMFVFHSRDWVQYDTRLSFTSKRFSLTHEGQKVLAGVTRPLMSVKQSDLRRRFKINYLNL